MPYTCLPFDRVIGSSRESSLAFVDDVSVVLPGRKGGATLRAIACHRRPSLFNGRPVLTGMDVTRIQGSSGERALAGGAILPKAEFSKNLKVVFVESRK